VTKAPTLDLEPALTGLADESTLSKIADFIDRIPQVVKFVKRMNAALASCGIHIDANGNGAEVATPPITLALPGPIHEDPDAAAPKKTRRRAGARKGVIPAHLKVPHVCAGKRFGCTKVTMGNAWVIHERTCKFLKAGLKAEEKAGIKPEKTAKASKKKVGAKAHAKKKAA